MANNYIGRRQMPIMADLQHELQQLASLIYEQEESDDRLNGCQQALVRNSAQAVSGDLSTRTATGPTVTDEKDLSRCYSNQSEAHNRLGCGQYSLSNDNDVDPSSKYPPCNNRTLENKYWLERENIGPSLTGLREKMTVDLVSDESQENIVRSAIVKESSSHLWGMIEDLQNQLKIERKKNVRLNQTILQQQRSVEISLASEKFLRRKVANFERYIRELDNEPKHDCKMIATNSGDVGSLSRSDSMSMSNILETLGLTERRKPELCETSSSRKHSRDDLQLKPFEFGTPFGRTACFQGRSKSDGQDGRYFPLTCPGDNHIDNKTQQQSVTHLDLTRAHHHHSPSYPSVPQWMNRATKRMEERIFESHNKTQLHSPKTTRDMSTPERGCLCVPAAKERKRSPLLDTGRSKQPATINLCLGNISDMEEPFSQGPYIRGRMKSRMSHQPGTESTKRTRSSSSRIREVMKSIGFLGGPTSATGTLNNESNRLSLLSPNNDAAESVTARAVPTWIRAQRDRLLNSTYKSDTERQSDIARAIANERSKTNRLINKARPMLSTEFLSDCDGVTPSRSASYYKRGSISMIHSQSSPTSNRTEASPSYGRAFQPLNTGTLPISTDANDFNARLNVLRALILKMRDT